MGCDRRIIMPKGKTLLLLADEFEVLRKYLELFPPEAFAHQLKNGLNVIERTALHRVRCMLRDMV